MISLNSGSAPIKLFACILLMLSSGTSFGQGYLSVQDQRIVNEKNENVLLRGIGLGGWMLQEGYMLGINAEGQQYRIRERIEALIGKARTAEFYESWLANHITKRDIDSLKAWGFNSVRLPMHFNLYTLPVEDEPVAGQNTWIERGFSLTDSLLGWCKANEMYLILDLHAAPGGQGNDLNISDRDPAKPSLWQSVANRQKTVALWRKLAERYVDEPWIGAYDLINEPNWGFEDPDKDKNGLAEKTNAPLRQLMMDITSAIREVDKKHIIIIEGNGWGNNYNGILPPWDKDMVLSFHKYWNFNNEASIKNILNYRNQYNIPVWLGETGENSNVWFTEAIALLEKHNIGWSWWPLKKLGLNNPLQIPNNPVYGQIQQFWAGKGTQPSAKDADQALMDLAEATNISRNRVQRDVVDAMIRQPSTSETIPFKKHVLVKGLSIKAVDFDLGRQGEAYYDADSGNYHISTGKRSAGNKGNSYRNDGVDIYKAADRDDHYVGSMEAGEWLQYTVKVSRAGSYKVRLRIASEDGGGLVALANGTKVLRDHISIPETGGEDKWRFVDVPGLRLVKGDNKIRVMIRRGGFNLSELIIR